MRIFGSLLAMTLATAIVAPAAARDIFVDNATGDDTFAGAQPRAAEDRSGPVRTIAHALLLADARDRIVLAKTNQPYRESISLVGSHHSGSPQQLFLLEGHGAILDGSAPVPSEAWQHYRADVFRFRPSHTPYQQLFLDDRPAARVPVASLADKPPKLGPRQWCLLGGEIYFCVEPAKLPQDYHLTCARLQTGITLFHVDHVGIVDLTVQGFQLDGINAFNSARSVYLSGVTCRGNGRSGIAVGGASVMELEGCLLGDNGSAQLLTLPWSQTHLRGCRLLSNTAPGWVDKGGQVYDDGKQVENGLHETGPTASAR